MPMHTHPIKLPARALAITLSLVCGLAQAVTVEFQRVADGVDADVGDTGARTADNEGLNANIGLVVTPAGAVLIDSGATVQSARQIAEKARKITPQPIRWVIITGRQEHRWLGNGCFQAQGAELIAHAGGEADMKNRGNDHLQALKAVLGAQADGSVPTLPTRWLQAPDERLELGGVVFEFKHRGGAHMKKAVDDGTDVSEAVKAFDATPFMRLRNAVELVPGNASRTGLELEREQAPSDTLPSRRASWTSRYSAAVVPTARTPSR